MSAAFYLIVHGGFEVNRKERKLKIEFKLSEWISSESRTIIIDNVWYVIIYQYTKLVVLAIDCFGNVIDHKHHQDILCGIFPLARTTFYKVNYLVLFQGLMYFGIEL